MEKWHLLFTKPRQENLALTNLMNQGEAIFRTYNGEEKAIPLLDFMTKKIDIKFALAHFKKLA